jgi:formyl-CoA transferase
MQNEDRRGLAAAGQNGSVAAEAARQMVGDRADGAAGVAGALSGIRVLDFTQVILGPAATQVLADFGADVIKVERPGSGDLARAFAPFLSRIDGDGQVSVRYLSANRNKRDLAVDLKSPAGREVIFRLIPTADVLVHNFRPGVMESLGLGYDEVRQRNPRLIYAEGSGWGSRGPMAEAKKPGQELLAQAYSGLAAKNAGVDGLPRALPTNVSDFTASQLLAQGILVALLARERTGQGQKVEVCLLDGLLAMQQWDECSRLNLGDLYTGVLDHHHPLQSIYRTSDGFVVLVGWFRADPLANVCRALSLPDLSQDERFCTLERMAQPEHAEALRAIIADRLASRTTAEWLATLEAHDVLCGEVLAPGEAYSQPQAQANGMVVTLDHPELGPVRVSGSPLKLSATPARYSAAPPAIGAHSREILAELGYSAAEQEALLRSGAVVQATVDTPAAVQP